MNRLADTPKTPGRLPKAIVRKDHLGWLLWLVPLSAAVLCGWFAYRDFIGTGPLITVRFQDVEGLQAQNTALLFRGMNVGALKEVNLSRDAQHVEVKIRLIAAAKDFARSGSEFWIVHPDVKIGSISGLRTLVSGEYIEVRPGGGVKTNRFEGLPHDPLPDRPGALEITLTSPHLGSLQELSPIFYRGVQVGEVAYSQLGADSREVTIHARVWREYAPLVHVDSKFWNAGGLAVHFGLFKGLQVSAESPRTIITGGLEFATPTDSAMAATNGTTYVINPKPEDKWKDWNPVIKLDLPAQAAQDMTLQTNVWPLTDNP
jgi:paraquat-inducible protein B